MISVSHYYLLELIGCVLTRYPYINAIYTDNNVNTVCVANNFSGMTIAPAKAVLYDKLLAITDRNLLSPVVLRSASALRSRRILA